MSEDEKKKIREQHQDAQKSHFDRKSDLKKGLVKPDFKKEEKKDNKKTS